MVQSEKKSQAKRSKREVRKRHKWSENKVCAFCGCKQITEKHPTNKNWTVNIVVDEGTGEIMNKGYCLTKQTELNF